MRQTSTPQSQGSMNSASRRQLENAASQVDGASRLLCGPGLGRDRRDAGRRHLHRGSPSGSKCRPSPWPGYPHRKYASDSPTLEHEPYVRPHCDPWRTPRLESCSIRGKDPRPEAFSSDVIDSSKSTPTNGSSRASYSIPTTSTPPSRNSMPDTLPAKEPHTRTPGRASSVATRRSIGANTLRRRRTG